jgi:hypothetical protein
MFKKIFVTTTLAVQVVGYCVAQTTLPSVTVENPHKAYEQKVRTCKKQAIDQHLTGEERRTFIAQCVTSAPAGV